MDYENDQYSLHDLSTLIAPNDSDNAEVKNLKTAVSVLVKTVQKQNLAIEELTNSHQNMQQNVVQHTNEMYFLSTRIVELERYSRKLCLIFSNVETENSVATVLSRMNNCLRMSINECDIAACHPLQNGRKLGPIIVKFIYHHHRDLPWSRRSWLRNFSNSENGKIYLDECLSPCDRQLKTAAKEKGVKVTTKKQVFAMNANYPNSKPVKVQSIDELEVFQKSDAKGRPARNQSNVLNFPQTPVSSSMPALIRKPSTPIPSVGLNRNKRTILYCHRWQKQMKAMP